MELHLFRCESATLRTHWVLLVIDQFTCRIIGFGVHGGIVDGLTLCRMFQQAIRGNSLPKYLGSDHDPLYRFHQWHANLRVLEVAEIKTVPYVPLSHPFVATDWHGSTRVPRPHFILDPSGIWRQSYSIFNITVIEHMPDWTDACQNPLLTDQHR